MQSLCGDSFVHTTGDKGLVTVERTPKVLVRHMTDLMVDWLQSPVTKYYFRIILFDNQLK